MRAGIFVASYAKDFPFLKGLLKSIQRFCHGFHRVSVAVPLEDKPLLLKLFKEWGFENGHNDLNLLIWEQNPHIRYPFMKAQFAMMSMDRYLFDCNYYYLVGSDCLFTSDVTPEHYFKDGKPTMFCRPMAERRAQKNPGLVWVPGTIAATGFDPEYDYMMQLPLVYTRRMLEVTKEQVHRHTGKPLVEYINQDHKNFSESNIMGVCAHRLCPEEFIITTEHLMPMHLVQFWSHGGLKQWRIDRSQFYNNREGKTECTRGRTAYEITVDVLGEGY